MIQEHEKVIEANWRWKHFSPREMACREDGLVLIVESFMDRLERLRIAFKLPMVISSGYRSPAYNDKISSTGLDGPHTTGRAVDVLIYGDRAFDLIWLAAKTGFTGIGVQQRASHEDRFIHIDDLDEAPGRPRPWVWSY